MADLAITAANVQPGSGIKTKTVTAGEAIAAGKAVAYAADGGGMLADSDSATALIRSPKGIALNSAAAGQPVTVCERGNVVLGAVLTAGVAYYLSNTPGGICPVADVGTGEYATVLGLAISTTTLQVGIQESGVAL